MCKTRIQEFAPPIQTNLSISITGADSFVEGAATAYTISLDLTGYIGSPDTVVTATLPAWITYVSSSDSGSFSSWLVTWTLGTLMADKNLTLTITSETPDTYEVDVEVTSSIGNTGTASDSKEIEVQESVGWVEVRITCALFNSWSWPTDIPVFTRWATDLLTSFTEDIVFINWNTYKVWTLSSVWWTWYTWAISFVFSAYTYNCAIFGGTPATLDWGWVPLNIVAWCIDDESPS